MSGIAREIRKIGEGWLLGSLHQTVRRIVRTKRIVRTLWVYSYVQFAQGYFVISRAVAEELQRFWSKAFLSGHLELVQIVVSCKLDGAVLVRSGATSLIAQEEITL